jgi:Mg-chelatase subunit ChlD
MKRFLSRKPTRRIKRALLALLALSVMMPLHALLAQNSAPPVASPSASLSRTADEVNKAGYSLKPTGLATNEWPNLRIDFSIERADQTIFKNLTLADVSAKIDGADVRTTVGDLEQKESQSSGVLVLLDGSGSMAGSGVDKLTAAKQSLKTLVDKLDANERVGLIVFDEEPRLLTSPTADKEQVKREIDSFTIRKDKSRFTRLYDAVRVGLEKAKENHVKNLLIISDGWEDTPETRSLSPAQLQSFKTEREQKLTGYSRENDIRVFTVAIGNERGEGLSYVDRTALDNISKGAYGGSAAYIELTPDLGTAALQESFLLSRLQKTLNDLRQSFGYSFSLTLRLDQSAQARGDEHKLWVGFTVGDNPRVQLPIEYTYVLPAEGVPIVKEMKVQPAIFIQSAPRTVTWQQLLFIYLVLLSTLIVLGFLPSVMKVLLRGNESVRLRKAIVTVQPASSLIGVACPNEGTEGGRLYLLKEGDVVLVCPSRTCNHTPHHLSCWAFNEHRCMQRNCETVLVVPDAVLEKHGLLETEMSEEHSWMTS